jgi:hypothetical protein
MRLDEIKGWILKCAKASFENAIKIHKYHLRKQSGWYNLIFAIIIYLAFAASLVSSDIKIGLSFIFSGFMALYTGVIYKGEHVMGYVLVGVILGTTVLPTLSEGWKSGIHGDWISAIVVFCLGVYLWVQSSRLKKGELPE